MDLSCCLRRIFQLSFIFTTLFPVRLCGHIWAWGLSLPLTQSDSAAEAMARDQQNDSVSGPDTVEGPVDLRPEAEGFCSSHKQCGRGRYCDFHFGKCERLKRAGDLCRKDFQCQRKHECVFGRCRREIPKGRIGARCEEDKDCPEDNCCARQHGEKICKPRLKVSAKCFIPSGGLDYSLNEECPCETGLICQYEPVKATSPSNGKNKDWFQISSDTAQMKCLPIG